MKHESAFKIEALWHYSSDSDGGIAGCKAAQKALERRLQAFEAFESCKAFEALETWLATCFRLDNLLMTELV